MLDNLFVLIFLLFQIESGPRITSPIEGAVLKDIIPITGITSIEGFQSAELSFTYAQEPIENWFVIISMADPVTEGILTQWDTRSITDGDYHLRLQVEVQDGSNKEFLVRDLRIRNYTALPTEQAESITTFAVPETSATPETTLTANIAPSLAPAPAVPIASPSPLPANPASLDRSKVFSTVSTSVFVTLLVFVILSLLFRSRRSG